MLKELKRKLRFELEKKEIFDIILYGSAIRRDSSPNDIDVMVIFLNGSLKERLEIIQQIKQKLDSKKTDIKQMLLKDLFSAELLSRKGILTEGISFRTEKKFCERLGLQSYSLFFYNLEDKTHTEKVKFNYILSGRTTSGVLKELSAKRIISGCITVPIENADILEKIMQDNEITYTRRDVLQ